jgi:hypothetical protein
MDEGGDDAARAEHQRGRARVTSSPDGTRWQGAVANGSPVTLFMENSVCCASNACL